jgi:tetratricopeptide (TPR) repeat protein
MNRYLIKFLTLVSVLTVSCSSLPRNQLSPAVREADNIFRMGNSFKSKGEYRDALHSFRVANQRYSALDHQEGVISSKIALITTSLKIDRSYPYPQDIQALAEYVMSTKPEFSDNLLLLKVEVAYLVEDMGTILELTEGFKGDDVILESQIIGYRMLALIEIGEQAESEFRVMGNNLSKLRRNYRRLKGGDDGVYSYINYLAGYYESKQSRWKKAEPYFLRSLEADKKADYSGGIAKNLYSLARVYHKLDRVGLAGEYYLRAANVYRSLGNEEMLRRINLTLENM